MSERVVSKREQYPTSPLPIWPRAEATYGKAYRVLSEMAQMGGVTKGRRGQCVVSQDMQDLIAALNGGDEEKIKGIMLLINTNGLSVNEREED